MDNTNLVSWVDSETGYERTGDGRYAASDTKYIGSSLAAPYERGFLGRLMSKSQRARVAAERDGPDLTRGWIPL